MKCAVLASLFISSTELKKIYPDLLGKSSLFSKGWSPFFRHCKFKGLNISGEFHEVQCLTIFLFFSEKVNTDIICCISLILAEPFTLPHSTLIFFASYAVFVSEALCRVTFDCCSHVTKTKERTSFLQAPIPSTISMIGNWKFSGSSQ